ncbi:2-(1,2-epoxy-1,2-dihydrophenyl)acetyl-CoA isomerase [Nitratireductor aquimarinus]|uniref:2-(1,2-epoxy-1,2-dihydrophenyl)acetyl-CoA isomerase PaaG n=1 Tax=Nitratireductor TaxID=245876 RepID=UPI0019D3C8E6|nr:MULTISPECIES: 2-(1,2-epoxy-1,2-dihydrophenyl)acetyl-CoA isomerase PaaG [Nitratireductor]MBN7778597.1 2-(1,2-epoxy-1,2-dihydrophenyl)acetyl-CoA isomerase [Nitratireductor pacificus]MBN7782920.1 2-(1,2-epoxy-1,2-dihydrophenyl)acetyl-CoA isomerase [Nitratireductor pacificus]MBN7791726.1 2-(1,2-epoxy-1,2-dihydrophenyl)acetyl-CoA isomerase [Nitratireductor aquimarinus]MBN8245372.1 2-(1,2-epoxy-1,2-dihydrophenyl)acetyl-CoA isomerase [Nitratireductor aquimarinus]MBY6100984.1 2-(1,2-epoxy-1,2-dihyd
MSVENNETILHERLDGWHRITLNRPEKLNAFNEAQHVALRDALEACSADEGCRAVLLTGAGRGFCAGQDLGDRDPAKMESKPDLGYTIENFYNPLVRKLRGMNKPIVCAVNGVAAGAGANIALACDIVLAAKSAKFIQAFAKIALVPDSGGTWFLTRILGEPRAKALALTGEPLSAEDAANWGLIWRAVEDEALMEEAEALVTKLAHGPTQAYGLIKKAIHAAPGSSLDAQLELERELQREAGRSDDYREGVAAFLEKRKPVFKG